MASFEMETELHPRVRAANVRGNSCTAPSAAGVVGEECSDKKWKKSPPRPQSGPRSSGNRDEAGVSSKPLFNRRYYLSDLLIVLAYFFGASSRKICAVNCACRVVNQDAFCSRVSTDLHL